MKAMVCTKYGSPDVLELREVEKPTPKGNEVLIKVFATTVTSGDCRVRKFNSPPLLWVPMRLALGLFKPRKSILGTELAGEVEAVGENVTKFKKGDQIYALPGMRFGTHAEYTTIPEKGTIELKPANMTFEEAAAIPFGGTTAVHFFRKADIQKGQNVLVYGASGAVGTAAVQLAKYYGTTVTGVCSGPNMELVKSLGADKVIDYTKEDFTKLESKYDIIFDAVGKISKSQCSKLLSSNGKFVSVKQGMASVSAKDLIFLRNVAESGKYKPVIDKHYPLERIPEAHRYVDKGHKKGNILITL